MQKRVVTSCPQKSVAGVVATCRPKLGIHSMPVMTGWLAKPLDQSDHSKIDDLIPDRISSEVSTRTHNESTALQYPARTCLPQRNPQACTPKPVWIAFL